MANSGEIIAGQSTDADRNQIALLVQRFFSVFTNKNGRLPRFELLNEICSPDAQFINETIADQPIMDIDAFIRPRRQILTDGTLTEFEELELDGETVINGNMAEHRSHYYKEGAWSDRPAFKTKGNKTIQLQKEATEWKITSVSWIDLP